MRHFAATTQGVVLTVCLVLCGFLAVAPHTAFARQAMSSSSSATPGPLVNINTATAAQFEALPGIGPKTAARILEFRQKNGNFKKIEELMNVRGIGEKNFLRIKPQLTLAAPKGEPQ
jgi:competence protein ComEA